MSYATILVALNADRHVGQLIDVAIDLSQKFSSKLVGTSALARAPVMVAGDYAPMTELDVAEIKAQLERVGDLYRAAVPASLTAEFRSSLRFPTDNLLEEARCADLIIVQASTSWETVYRDIDVGAAILGA